ncbi:MAG: glycosyltransferase [Hyphomicrobiales bacterium]|nr:glycosyltransferase [Hyphomicrobiales bacterium]
MRLLGVHRIHYRKGGAEAVHFDHLALFREHGWTCAEFVMDHPLNEPSEWSSYFPSYFDPPGGLKGLPATPRFFHSSEARAKFARLLDDFKPDIIHAHGLYQQLTSAIVAPARARNIPFVYTLHDFKLICPAYFFYNRKKGVCEECRGGAQWRCAVNNCCDNFAKSALYAADGLYQWRKGEMRHDIARYIAPSRFLARKYAEHGFDAERIRYVPNFFETQDDAPADAAMMATLRARHGRYLAYFGRLSQEKGVSLLIDAAHAAKTPLVLVGDGPQRADLEAQVRALGADCVFVGHQSGPALWAHVEAAVAVALPSIWYENAPKSILEAQARGKPAIVSELGGLPEMVEDGVTGFICKSGDRASLADCIARLFALEPGALAAMGEKARASARTNFTRERYYREMARVYAELAPGAAP